MNSAQELSENDVRGSSEYLGQVDFQLRRYPTGLCNYNYEVIPQDTPAFVLGMSRSDLGDLLKRAQYCGDTVRPLGIPLPATLPVDLEGPFPYRILRRLEVTDLGEALQ